MAVKRNTRAPRKRPQSRVEKIAKTTGVPAKRVKNRKVLVIAQEIKFARLLANNDKRVRDKMLKNLKKWLKVRSESSFSFTKDDFMRLWKGLFFCMWMSDKPLIQEELAESLSNIVHSFDSMDTALLYTKCTLKTLAREWYGIDQYRVDKFQMLVRRIVRQTFEMCRRKSWDEEWTKGAAQVFQNILLSNKTTLGFSLHLTELYMEELAKIGGGSIPTDMVTELLRPFAIHLSAMDDERQIRHVMKHIFRYLIFQSDVGMDYMEKFEAWRQAGFPRGNIDAMEKVEVSDDEAEAEEESEEVACEESESNGPKALDPRAGRVDVELPQLPFDPLEIAKLLKEYRFNSYTTTKTRRQIVRLFTEFTKLAQGEMPLGVKEVDVPVRKSAETNPKKAAYRLLKFEKELYSDTIRRRRRRKQTAPPIEDDEGFENLLEPIDPETSETNGFHGDVDNSDPSSYRRRCLGSDDEIMETEEPIETPHISQKANKGKKKNSIELSKKTTNKKLKKQKFAEKQKNVDEEIDDEAEEKQSGLIKSIKVRSKKLKTKKFLNAVKSLNQKLLNRSSNDVPTKAKRPRLSNDSTWDVSIDDEVPTPAASPKTKIAKITNAKAPEAKLTNESDDTVSSSNLTKEQIDKIPWLHPVLMKLEDTKDLLTPTKTPPEAQCGSSAKKRVKIMLRRNTAQLTSEYMRQLRQNPAIPYDASKKPLVGVLKPSPLSSPVNPFYKRT